MTHNKEIRSAITTAGVKYWRVAERLGIADTTFSRKLRRELPQAEKDRVLQAIADAAAEKAGDLNE